MALPPIIGRTPQPPATTSPAADARTAAQRAFFQAALVKAGGPTAVQPAPARAETRAVQPAVTKVQDEVVTPPHPGRILRPGSLVDIKV